MQTSLNSGRPTCSRFGDGGYTQSSAWACDQLGSNRCQTRPVINSTLEQEGAKRVKIAGLNDKYAKSQPHLQVHSQGSSFHCKFVPRKNNWEIPSFSYIFQSIWHMTYTKPLIVQLRMWFCSTLKMFAGSCLLLTKLLLWMHDLNVFQRSQAWHYAHCSWRQPKLQVHVPKNCTDLFQPLIWVSASQLRTH